MPCMMWKSIGMGALYQGSRISFHGVPFFTSHRFPFLSFLSLHFKQGAVPLASAGKTVKLARLLASRAHPASRGPAISHPSCPSPLSLGRIGLNMTGNNFEHIIELWWCETPKDRSVREARESGSRENN